MHSGMAHPFHWKLSQRIYSRTKYNFCIPGQLAIVTIREPMGNNLDHSGQICFTKNPWGPYRQDPWLPTCLCLWKLFLFIQKTWVGEDEPQLTEAGISKVLSFTQVPHYSTNFSIYVLPLRSSFKQFLFTHQKLTTWLHKVKIITPAGGCIKRKSGPHLISQSIKIQLKTPEIT